MGTISLYFPIQPCDTLHMMRYTVLGNTDEHTECDCCGRADLKATVALFDNEAGKEVFFGCVCASRAIGVPALKVRQEAKLADKIKAAKRNAEWQATNKADENLWQAFLDKKAGPRIQWKFERFHQIEKLGGPIAARKMFLESTKG